MCAGPVRHPDRAAGLFGLPGRKFLPRQHGATDLPWRHALPAGQLDPRALSGWVLLQWYFAEDLSGRSVLPAGFRRADRMSGRKFLPAGFRHADAVSSRSHLPGGIRRHRSVCRRFLRIELLAVSVGERPGLQRPAEYMQRRIQRFGQLSMCFRVYGSRVSVQQDHNMQW